MNTSARNLHPNRLIVKHEQYLVNKSLTNKIKNAKSTLNLGNQTFERIITNRQKKDLQRSVLVKVRSTESQIDSEVTQTDQTESFLSPKSCILSPKRSEAQPLRLITPLSRENIDDKSSSLSSVRNKLLPLIASPRPGLKSSVYSSTGQQIVEGLGHIINKKTKENQAETLKNRLLVLEKSIETEGPRKELKAWWLDDITYGKIKENIGEPRIRPVESPLAVSLHELGSKSMRTVLNRGAVSPKEHSERKLKKGIPLGTEERRLLIGSVTKLATYDQSLKILERFEELERSNKKSQTPSGSNSLRLSTNFSRKSSMRYKTEEDEEVSGNDELRRMSIQGSLSRIKENASVVKEKYTNIRYKTLELDGEESDEENLKIYDKPKTLILQSK